MAEVLATNLHLYRDPLVTIPDIHPALTNAAPIVHDPVIIGGQPVYDVEFATHFKSQDLQANLAEPVAPYVDAYTAVNFRKGLRSQTYPNGRIMKVARAHKGLGLLGHLREIRPDLLQLVDTVEQDIRTERVPATLHVYDDDSALETAGSRAASMDAAKLKILCDEIGIPVNEVILWKLRGGRRAQTQNFSQDILRLGIAPLEIQQAIVDRDFLHKWVINSPRFASALFDKLELPRLGYRVETPFVELIRRLQNPQSLAVASEAAEVTDDVPAPKAERWQVNLLRNNVARRVVNAVIRFTYEESAGEVRKRLVLSGASKHYNPVTHEVVYASPLMGAALLVAATIDSSELADKLRLINTNRPGYRHYKSYKPGKWHYGEGLPREAVGTLPGVLGMYTSHRSVINSAQFQVLESLVHNQN